MAEAVLIPSRISQMKSETTNDTPVFWSHGTSDGVISYIYYTCQCRIKPLISRAQVPNWQGGVRADARQRHGVDRVPHI